ncbi:MAG TPA: deoxyribonuclease V, partial [Ktedonobacterales bacterium]|nr:deoxyribonuclease V [Ktedonobacterales bacterium]
LDDIRTVAGVDVSYGEVGRAAVVVLSFPALEVLEEVAFEGAARFPYVPGLLSFREGPLALAALERVQTRPDVLMFDGQGYAHPRRLGLASHLGVYLDMPSIGAAKSRLVGTYVEPGPNIGDRSPLVHRGEVVGVALRTKPRTNPLFVSAGHKLDLETAVAVVLRCLRGYRLPEPTRLADKLTKSGKETGA